MIVFRIAQKKYIDDLSGKGAKLFGGRWNYKGNPVLYCASTSSLAILEILVHTDIDLLPNLNLYIAELYIPDNSFKTITEDELPQNWKSFPAPDKLKSIGHQWIEKNEFLNLGVPSAVNPLEWNFMLNCKHTEFQEVKTIRSFPLFMNERLKNN